jgi:hypothetical protein
MTDTTISNNGCTLTVSLPINLRKRGGRKQVVVPDNATWSEPARVKAIARAFRRRKLLETGVYTTIDELAAAEAINPSYVSRVLRLTLLAPDIVEAVLDGTLAHEVTIATLMKPFPVIWVAQSSLCVSTRASSVPCLSGLDVKS